MVWLSILLCSVLLTLLYLLWAPIYIEVNSLNDLYRIRFHHLMSLSIKNENCNTIFEMKVLFWKKKINFMAPQMKEQNVLQSEINDVTKAQTVEWNKIKNVLKSFKLNTCYISLDSGNMQLNGVLYPFLYFISTYYKKQIGINFVGNNDVIFEIENNLARIIRAYIKP